MIEIELQKLSFSLRNYLNRSKYLNQLSIAGVNYLLRRILMYSYKKGAQVEKNKMMARDRKRDFMKSAYFQLFFNKSGYKLVYLDEFHISIHQESIYNWSKRGVFPIVAVNLSSFVMSFVITFSIDRIEDVLASNHSVNSKSFSIFLMNLRNLSKVKKTRTRRLVLFFIIQQCTRKGND